ncbi:low-specificity L-threonine aldolase [Kiloniella sp. EL199]|uniref:low-specificity L-threonine aldolase n=1 Tax=Kiloniella sp. EL199 TaxID=2107581 RepID=UPI001C1F92B8|nr:low-specificity L-threonine aldolase [Kiloniella sp. EL199]
MYSSMLDRKDQIGSNSGLIADFRSDTVTRPSKGMLEAMAKAKVGDDVYDDDPTVAELERKLAEMAGMENALFFPTGTQSNLAALLSYCGRGDEYIAGDEYHIFIDEAGGAAVLGGISPFPLPTDNSGGLDPQQVKDAIKPDDFHCPISRLLCLENTVSGRVQNPERIAALAKVAHENNLSVHLDGARIFNAATALNLSLKTLCEPVDSISICLSKGLGVPIGSVLCGSEYLIKRAKRMRKLLGGGMRQVGVLAACGLYALEHHVPLLENDHNKAMKLARGLQSIPEVTVDLSTVETNMVFMNPGKEQHQPLCDYLFEEGILIGAQVPEIRLVTHMDISNEAIELFIEKTRFFYQMKI